MNILWSIHLYPPTHNCGSEYVAHHVNKFLASKGHRVRVLLHRDKNINTPYEFEGIEVFGSRTGGRVDTYRWADIVMTHLDFTHFTLGMAHSAERPLIHFVHNDIKYEAVESAPKGQYVIYNSNWIKDKLNYRWHSTVLHPPCDINHYNVNDDPYHNEAITLISLNERKGGFMLKKIAEAMPDRKFIGVVGSYDNPGPLKLSQDEIIQLMPPNVEIIPNSPDILKVYKRTRVLIMPSDYESWGRTATEAMCNGIPVICTPTDGLEENCGQAAIYIGAKRKGEPGAAQVYIGTTEQWVRAIKALDHEETYKKYSLACRARAGELDPVKELEQLEQFLLNTRF